MKAGRGIMAAFGFCAVLGAIFPAVADEGQSVEKSPEEKLKEQYPYFDRQAYDAVAQHVRGTILQRFQAERPDMSSVAMIDVQNRCALEAVVTRMTPDEYYMRHVRPQLAAAGKPVIDEETMREDQMTDLMAAMLSCFYGRTPPDSVTRPATTSFLPSPEVRALAMKKPQGAESVPTNPRQGRELLPRPWEQFRK